MVDAIVVIVFFGSLFVPAIVSWTGKYERGNRIVREVYA